MTQNVHQKFTERENQLRLYVIQFTIDRQRAFHLERDEEEAVCALQMSHEEYEKIIERLIERDGMVIDEEKNVNFTYEGNFTDNYYDGTITATWKSDTGTYSGTFKADMGNIEIIREENGKYIYLDDGKGYYWYFTDVTALNGWRVWSDDYSTTK